MKQGSVAIVSAMVMWQVVSLAENPPESTRRSTSPRGATVSAGAGEYRFLGTKRCRMCHAKQHRSLLSTSKSRSWEALKPGNGGDVKGRAGLGVAEDYTRDGRCLPCHSVGYGAAGGYAVPDLDDPESVRFASGREGVGCESCHGPGSGFVVVMQDIYKNERKYYPAEVEGLGRRVVDSQTCLRCHNDRAICVNWNDEVLKSFTELRFRGDIANRRGFHEAFEFRFRRAEVSAKSGKTDGGDNPIPNREE